MSGVHVLVVDDWDHRHQLIRRTLLEGGVSFSATFRFGPEHVTLGDLQTADVVFLDHDMCQQRMTAAGVHLVAAGACPRPRSEPGFNALNRYCGCPNGVDMVKRLQGRDARPTVIVHTQNQTGGDRMVFGLKRAGFPVHRMAADRIARLDPRLLAKSWGLL